MNGARAPDIKEIVKTEYETGKYTFKQLAEKFNISEGTIKSWAKRDKDNKQPWKKKVATKQKAKTKKVATEKKVEEDKKEEAKLSEVEDIMNSELTDKQKLFCIYYIKYFNATKAAMKAGYSKDTAYAIGHENLNKPKIQEEIQRLKANKLKGAFLDKEDIVQKYIDIAFADLTDYIEYGYKEQVLGYTEDGQPIMGEANYMNFKQGEEIDGTILSEIKTSRQGASIKLHDKMKALEWLSNFFEMNPEFKYRREHDYKKLQLERERFEHQKKMDESKVW